MFPVLPPKRNSPPRVVSTVPAQRDKTVELGGACPREEFSVNVEDLDLDNKIASKWFINANSTYTFAPGLTLISGNTIPGGQDRVRTITAPSSLQTALTAQTPNTPHRVEVLVTDGDFEELETGLRATGVPVLMPDGGFEENPAFIDNHVWIVTIKPCSL